MNRLILVGNGFDLAHGLKTGYNDFIVNYVNQCFTTAWETYNYEDDLIEIRRTAVMVDFPISGFRTLPQYLKYFYETGYLPLIRNTEVDYKGSRYKPFFAVKVKVAFLEHLLLNCRLGQWVDIENEFYHQLKLILNSRNEERKLSNLTVLNSDMGHIINQLHRYMSELPAPVLVDRYRNIFKSDIKEIEVPLNMLPADSAPENTLILNFNYTATAEQYLNQRTDPAFRFNYIHGKLNTPANPLIFGFGDELDDDYLKMEKEQIKGYFEYIKSFWYFKTANYRDLIRFIDGDQFQVFVMGHSCGLSDRTMLNMIFQHPKCVSIKVYYYKNGDRDNFFDLTQEIARHFKDKEIMRRKIVSQDLSEPMPQWTDRQ